jgi:hypothetical protein
VLYEAMSRRGVVSVLERSGYAAAIATALIFAANMAVDGVALKRAVDAWAAAADADKPVRFAAAETVRWLEWGANSFFQILLGLTLILVWASHGPESAGDQLWLGRCPRRRRADDRRPSHGP